MNKSIEQKFDANLSNLDLLDRKDIDGWVMSRNTISKVKSFFDSTIKQAAEEIRRKKWEEEHKPTTAHEFERFGVNQGLEAAAKHLESLI